MANRTRARSTSRTRPGNRPVVTKADESLLAQRTQARLNGDEPTEHSFSQVIFDQQRILNRIRDLNGRLYRLVSNLNMRNCDEANASEETKRPHEVLNALMAANNNQSDALYYTESYVEELEAMLGMDYELKTIKS